MLTAHAKTVLASLAAAIIIAGQAWQMATVDGFQLLDVLPIATALTGALLTFVVPNVPELPWAKSVVHGAAAVLTALATFVAGHPAGVTIANLGTVAVFSFLVWFVPESPVAQLVQTLPPVPPAAPAAASAVPAAPAVEHAVWTQAPLPPVVPAARLEATPIADDVQSALQTTSPLPAIPADTPPPVPVIPAA